MSSELFDRALELRQKAAELEANGRMLRAADNFGQAAEAVRTLDPGPDNFAALELQLARACMFCNYMAVASELNVELDPAKFAEYRAESIALFSTVVAALERRRVAGTLLEGGCTATEEAWHAAVLRVGGCPPAEVGRMQTLGGYHTFISAAMHVLDVLGNGAYFVHECSAMQLATFAQFVVHAMDLMQVPRRQRSRFGTEVGFAMKLSERVQLLRPRGLHPRLAQEVTDAWRRLQQSGVLVERQLLDERVISRVTATDPAQYIALKAALIAPDLRCCALASCGAREAHPAHFKRCTACKAVVYCGPEHQLADWPAHKAACQAASMTSRQVKKRPHRRAKANASAETQASA